MTEPRPTVEPTAWRQVGLAVVLGFAMSWLVLTMTQDRGIPLPLVGPIAWASVLLIAAGVGWLAWQTRSQVRTRPDTLDPRQALIRVLLGKASVLGGMALAGAYAGLLGLAVVAWPAPLAVDRVTHGGVAFAGCLAWAIAGWTLERSCRIRDDRDDDTPGDGGEYVEDGGAP